MKKYWCNLKGFVEDAQISSEEFSLKTGISKSDIECFISKGITPGVLEALKISKVLGVEIHELWGGYEDNVMVIKCPFCNCTDEFNTDEVITNSTHLSWKCNGCDTEYILTMEFKNDM